MIDKDILERSRTIVSKIGADGYGTEDFHDEHGIDDDAAGEFVVEIVEEAISSGQFADGDVSAALGAGWIDGFDHGVVAARLELGGGK